MIQSLTSHFPSLKTYLELVKAFQRSLFPNTGSLFSTLQQPVNLKNFNARSTFQFAAGVSQDATLSVAVVDCINQVQQQLGHGVHPHLCQLLVTTEPYGAHLSLAPRYVQEIFGTYGLNPPVLIGGAVEALLGLGAHTLPKSPLGQQFALRPSKGVSLLAAVLPGVTIHPFHTRDTALPGLPWDQLLRVGYTGPEARHKAAAVMLSEPHFTQVGELLGRVQSAMPGMPIVGGVLRHNAWGSNYGSQRSMRGALFIGEESVDEGAVGCILNGPLQVDAICTQGCRPVGPQFKVTEVYREGSHNFAAELDHQPAYKAVVEAQKSGLEARDRLLQLQVGVDVAGDGRGFVQYSAKPGPRGSIDVGSAEIQAGSLLQLHVQDPEWAQQKMRQQLQCFADGLPPEVKADPTSLGGFLYSCTAVAHNEEAAIQTELPALAFQGTKVNGEIGRIPAPEDARKDNGSSLVQSYSSSFGFMRQCTQTEASTDVQSS